MSISNEQELILRGFLREADFRLGSIVLDLDGTALHEDRGKLFISSSVEAGVKEIMAHNRPVIVNSLRFPLSVIRAIAEQWLTSFTPSMPCILLNGSLLGTIEKDGDEICFLETAAFPLERMEIAGILLALTELLDNDVRRITLFYYPRDWRKGEHIWVPDVSRIEPVRQKYVSASEVFTCDLVRLKELLGQEDICMMSILVDRPLDTLMAYQHEDPSRFHNRTGVDKAFGTKELAKKLKISLQDSLGAGDTRMDTFLSEVGLAVTVGDGDLPFYGRRQTMKVQDPAQLGELLVLLAQSVERTAKK